MHLHHLGHISNLPLSKGHHIINCGLFLLALILLKFVVVEILEFAETEACFYNFFVWQRISGSCERMHIVPPRTAIGGKGWAFQYTEGLNSNNVQW